MILPSHVLSVSVVSVRCHENAQSVMNSGECDRIQEGFVEVGVFMGWVGEGES